LTTSSLGVTLQPGETDDGNKVDDMENASITGSVTNDDDKPVLV
jgi:hypothetical protein